MPQFLDRALILDELDPDVERRLERLDIHEELDSTNQALLNAGPPANGMLAICVADYQAAGRGRRGRSWKAPPGGALCFSAGWLFDKDPTDLTGLALALGVVTRDVLREAAGIVVDLKWPNDLVWDDKKLGGILVEFKRIDSASCYVVAGIGINVSIPEELLATVAAWPRGAVDLLTATDGKVPTRCSLTARLVSAIVRLADHYGETGFVGHRDAFAAADYLRGRRVSIDDCGRAMSGIAAGVDDNGALLIDTDEGLQRVVSGDVSVRTIV